MPIVELVSYEVKEWDKRSEIKGVGLHSNFNITLSYVIGCTCQEKT